MAVPYVFANATSAIPLSNLDNNFSTPVTIGNVAIQLGNTATTLSNLSLANVTITSSSISNITGSTANAVVYANTTSTLITGSALQFDGTNLGIGTSTPSSYSSQLVINAGSANAAVNIQTNSFAGTYSAALNFGTGGQGAGNQVPYYTQAQIKAVGTNDYSAAIVFSNQGSGTSNPLVERMRLDSSGRLLVGTTSALINESTLSLLSSGNTMTVKTTGGASTVPMLCWNNAASGTINLINFFYGSSITGGGTITTNGTITTLNNPSDYRLKNVTGNLTTASTFINSLKPYVGTYKVNGSPFVGFLAHEVAEISPSSVQGEKDAVDENGDPIYQSLAYSSPELVTNMVAYIQELSEKITSLTDRITALEAK